MTAATLAYLPVQVGGVALASAGRAALWATQRFMRAPLTNTAIAALVVTCALAGSNALFGQRHAHPAPLFAPFEASTAPAAVEAAPVEAEPVVPATRPKKFGVTTTTAPVVGRPIVELAPPAAIPAADSGPIGNKDVFEVQRKLAMLKLFNGTIDGYYGPQTAGAIRKFEELNGLKVTGELTPGTVEAIKAAPLTMNEPQERPAADSMPAVTVPSVRSAPVEADLPQAAAGSAANARSLAEITEVKPLSSELNTGSIGRKSTGPVLLGRPVPDTPEEAFEMAAATAGDAIDAIISGVETVAMNKPGQGFGPAQPYAADSKPLETGTIAPAQLAALPDKPKVGVPLQINEPPPKPGEAIAVLDTTATPQEVAPVSVTDPVTVAKVQRGLASLGFLHGPADGVAGEATAKAIRNFETYFNYQTTGRISPELLDLLVENGASI